MFEELEKLITLIIQEYDKMFEKWQQNELYIHINQKNKQVKDIENDNEIMNAILNYRLFINDNHINLNSLFYELNLKNEVTTRVKAQNSIEYKVSNYMSERHEYGNVPLNKCFNDIYGIRIVMSEKVKFKDIKEFIENKYKGLKCYDASKGEYVATHVYFKKNNYSFQWELQIWDKEYEKSNIFSHGVYKQDYTKWEKENKGGVFL